MRQKNARREWEDRKMAFQDHIAFSILKSRYRSIQVSERNSEIKIEIYLQILLKHIKSEDTKKL